MSNIPNLKNAGQKALLKLLNDSRLKEKDGDKHEYRGLGPIYSGKYNIDRGNRRLFYDLIFKTLADKHNPAPVCLVEVHRNYGPVVIDLDFKYRCDNGTVERRYKLSMVRELIQMYIDTMTQFYMLEPEQLESVVMEKEKPGLQKGMCKDGVHVMFPNVCIENEMQLLFRKKVLRRLDENNIFHEVRAENKLADILDEAVIERNGWMVYGCQKPDGLPYIITHIFNHELVEEVTPVQYAMAVEEKHEMNIIQFLSIRKFRKADVAKLNYGVTQEMVETELYTHGLKNQDREIKDPGLYEIKGNQVLPREQTIDEKVQTETNNIAIAKRLVGMLSYTRADNYHDWIQLGMCLHTISETLIDTWIQFSQKNPEKYRPGECERYWQTFNRKELRMGTLYYWAKKDSPAEFKKFKQEHYGKYIEMTIYQGTPTRMAELIYHLYKDFYVTIASSNDKWVWYEFDGLCWNNLGTMAPEFFLKVEKELVALFNSELRRYQDLAARARSDLSNLESQQMNVMNAQNMIEEKVRLEMQVKKFKLYCDNINTLLFKKLGSPTYLKTVINHSGYHFYDSQFLNKLDKKLHLICFQNGVYDLENDCFRNGLYEDFISTKAGVRYRPRNADPEQEHYYDVVLKMLRENHPDPEDFEYLMLLYASCLQGYREDESFHILKGKGANGKTIETLLLKTAFGEYFTTISSALLTQKRGASNAAQPDILKLMGKRIAVCEEPDKTEVLNAGIMKELTGNGTLSARALYSGNIVTFKCTFALFLCTNTYPPVHTTDGGTWRRIKVIEYPCKYVSHEADLDPSNPYVKLGDGKLKKKVESMEYAEAFMAILIDYYRIFKQKGLYPPPNVRSASEGYQKMSNMYLTFCRDKLLHTANRDHRITMVELFNIYKVWYDEATGRKVNANRNEFSECICKELGLPENTRIIYGYKLKEDDFDDEPASE